MNDNHRQSDDGSVNDNDLFSGISFEDTSAEDQNTSFGIDLNKELDSLFSEDLGQSSFLQDIYDGTNTGTNQGIQDHEKYHSQNEIWEDVPHEIKEEIPHETKEEVPHEIMEEISADTLEEVPPPVSDRQQEDDLESLVEEILRSDSDTPKYEDSRSAQEPAGGSYTAGGNDEKAETQEERASDSSSKKGPKKDEMRKISASDIDRDSSAIISTKSRGRSLFLLSAAIFIAAGIIFAGRFFIGFGTVPGMHSASQTETGEGSDYRDLSVFGSRYKDIYTKKYIASYEGEWGVHYPEICVIDPTWIIGSAENPIVPEENQSLASISSVTVYGCYNRFEDDEEFSLWYRCSGFTVSYARPDEEPWHLFIKYVYPPAISDRDRFFKAVKNDYKYPAQYGGPDDTEFRTGDILETEINGNPVYYIVIDFDDPSGLAYRDVISFEEKPMGYAFLTGYRFRPEEYSDPEQALLKVYEHLEFYTDDFESIEAGGQFFDQTRLYNLQNGHSAVLDFSDMEITESYLEGPDQVTFYSGDYSLDHICVKAEYNDTLIYSHSDGPFENYQFDFWEFQYLDDFDYFDYSDKEYEIENTDYKQFSFDGRTVRYYVYDVTETETTQEPKSYVFDTTETEQDEALPVKFFWFVIEEGHGGEIVLAMEYKGTFADEFNPESFDPESFLEKHLTLE